MNARVTNLHPVGSGGIRDMICAKALGVEGHGALHLPPKCFCTYSHIFTAFASFFPISRYWGKNDTKVVNIRFHHSHIVPTL